jgi:hypothetical protein
MTSEYKCSRGALFPTESPKIAPVTILVLFFNERCSNRV